jgi:hypothetical protein
LSRRLKEARGHHFLFALKSSRAVALSKAAQGQTVQALVFPDK